MSRSMALQGSQRRYTIRAPGRRFAVRCALGPAEAVPHVGRTDRSAAPGGFSRSTVTRGKDA